MSRRRPGEIAYSSSGNYGAVHFPMEMMAKAANVSISKTIAIGGGLSISALANNGAGKLKFELGPINSSDKITVGGTLTIGTAFLGFGDFEFTALSGLENGTYTLLPFSTTLRLEGDRLTGTFGLSQLPLLMKYLEVKDENELAEEVDAATPPTVG